MNGTKKMRGYREVVELEEEGMDYVLEDLNNGKIKNAPSHLS